MLKQGFFCWLHTSNTSETFPHLHSIPNMSESLGWGQSELYVNCPHVISGDIQCWKWNMYVKNQGENKENQHNWDTVTLNTLPHWSCLQFQLPLTGPWFLFLVNLRYQYSVWSGIQTFPKHLLASLCPCLPNLDSSTHHHIQPFLKYNIYATSVTGSSGSCHQVSVPCQHSSQAGLS